MTVAALPASMVAGVMATVDFERLTAPAAGASAANATKVVPPELVSNDVRFVNALVIFTTKPSVVPKARGTVVMEIETHDPRGIARPIVGNRLVVGVNEILEHRQPGRAGGGRVIPARKRLLGPDRVAGSYSASDGAKTPSMMNN